MESRILNSEWVKNFTRA